MNCTRHVSFDARPLALSGDLAYCSLGPLGVDHDASYTAGAGLRRGGAFEGGSRCAATAADISGHFFLGLDLFTAAAADAAEHLAQGTEQTGRRAFRRGPSDPRWGGSRRCAWAEQAAGHTSGGRRPGWTPRRTAPRRSRR